MARRYVKELRDQESVTEVYRAGDKQLRPNSKGNYYLQFTLSDKTGSISARLWNATEASAREFDNGDFVVVEGATQIYQGALQMIAKRISRADRSQVDEADFWQLSPAQLDALMGQLHTHLRAVRHPFLRSLADCFLADRALMDKISRAPAGIRNHHAYHGGLAEHIVQLMHVCRQICSCYTELNTDLMILGAFLHDLGKVDELIYDSDLRYSDEGQLIGHLVMGVEMLDDKVSETEAMLGESAPRDLILQLKHIIVSHHGEYAYGSPKLPMTREALALHLLDNLDAKLHTFGQLLREEALGDQAWTTYHPNLARKIYRGEG